MRADQGTSRKAGTGTAWAPDPLRVGSQRGSAKHTTGRVAGSALVMVLLLAGASCTEPPDQIVEGNAPTPEPLSESTPSTSFQISQEQHSPVAEETNTSAATTDPPFAAGNGCPVPPSGEWSGTWQSQRIDISGTATAVVDLDGAGLTGSLDLRGPADVYLIDSGPISGSVDCLEMALSVSDDTLELNGSITPDGRSFSGTYDVSLNGGTITDYGTFSLGLHP